MQLTARRKDLRLTQAWHGFAFVTPALVVPVILALTACRAGPACAAPSSPAPADATMGARVFIMGDSMGELVSYAMKKALEQHAGVAVDSFISLGSGLARNDLFDWPKKLRSIMATFKPTIVVVVIGTTDNQKMMGEGGLLAFGTPAWNDEYARRVREIMNICGDGQVETVVWIGLPDMRDPQLDRDLKIITGIFKEQLASQPGFSYLDTTTLFSTTPGRYSAYIIKRDGMPFHVRSADGKHVNTAGAELLAQAIIARLAADLPKSTKE